MTAFCPADTHAGAGRAGGEDESAEIGAARPLSIAAQFAPRQPAQIRPPFPKTARDGL